MADHFEVGEIAIYHRPQSDCHGMEMAVASGLQTRTCLDEVTGRRGVYCGYEIKFACYSGREMPYRWLAELHELRKRRPPQDWVKLCRLTQRPVEEVA
jgi:hypothetical protein